MHEPSQRTPSAHGVLRSCATSYLSLALLASLALSPLGLGCGGSSAGGDPDASVDMGGDMGIPNPDQGMACPTGTQDADGNGTCEPDCASIACEHGTCTESAATGLAVCTCGAGFTGDACDTLVRPAASAADFWIDAAEASSLSYHSGRFVSGWTDLSSSGIEGASADQASAPQRVDGAQNELPVIRFDGVDDAIAFPGVAAFSQATASYTAFLVVRASPDVNGQIFFGEGAAFSEVELTASEGEADQLTYTHAPADAFMEVEVEADARQYGDASGWTNDAFHLVTIQRTRESLVIWIDGNHMLAKFDVFSEFAEQILTEALTLTFSPSGDPIAMDLGEMIVVSSALHYGERKPFEDYLAAKWFGAAFARTPSAFGETTVWLDASAGDDVIVAGGGVTTWVNHGIDGGAFGNGAFADARPAYEATGLNGRATVRFDGGDALVQNDVRAEVGAIRGEYTIIVVVDPPTTGSTQMIYRAINAADDDPAFRLDILPTVPSLQYQHVDWSDPLTFDTFAPAIDVSAPHVVLVERRESGQFSIRVDGTTSSFAGTDALDYTQSNFHWSLGGEEIQAPGPGLVGAVSEFIVMNNRLNAAEEEALIGALREKWGL
ncbi:MAG: hypothetical protein H6726_02845 [Sandaracinaceae bacterium]|nr:hypothetical protein [Myxococcales bacterium]MCB9656562.1 hypothetical protein [Sandaracinaceae bacterium]